jgi:TRAP-type uncharacterized transport system fused permease subunit
MTDSQWNAKQLQFNAAMQRYEGGWVYPFINKVVSWLNISLQIFLVILAVRLDVGLGWQIFAIVVAFVLADLVSGFVHLYMDHNDHYASVVGPFIAAFHLHHDTPQYTNRPLIHVYVDESGSKQWLVVFLVFLSLLSLFTATSPVLLCIGAYFAVFSSLSELSHYLCHNSSAKAVHLLQRMWILLPKKHHMLHHSLDNVSYAFLNGMSDPFINWIARNFYSGYRSGTELHTELYQHNRHMDHVIASKSLI